MVAVVRPVAARSKENVADHVLHQTEPVEERDEISELEGLPRPGEHRGSLPRVRPDMSPKMAAVTGLKPGETPTREEVREVAGGYRADGTPLPRSKFAAGRKLSKEENERYPPALRRKGQGRWTTKQGAPRTDDPSGQRRTDVVDVMLYPHIKWAIAHANAETKAGRAAVMSVIRAAADDTMAVAEQKMAWTRRGQGGRLGPEQGEWTYIQLVQHSTRPDKDGKSYPGLHLHHMIPPVVLTEGGHVGAIHTTRALGEDLDKVFQERLVVRGREAGIRVALEKGAAVPQDVPDNVSEWFSRRTREAEKDAAAYIRRALKADPEQHRKENPSHWNGLVRIGARKTEGHHRDGMADRDLWRAQCADLGFPPTDVARPRSSVPSAGHVLGEKATLRQQAAEMVSASTRTKIMQAVAEQQAFRRNMRPANLRAFMVRKAQEAFIATAASSVMLLAESRALQKATAATLAYADRMGAAIRDGFARYRDAQLLDAAARNVAEKRKPAEDLAALRKEAAAAVAESVVTAKLAEATPPAAIREAVARVREEKTVEAAAEAVLARPRRAEAAQTQQTQRGRRPPAPHPRPTREPITQAEAEIQLRAAMTAKGIDHAGHSIEWGKRTLTYLPARDMGTAGKAERNKGGYRAYFDGKRPAAALYNYKHGGFVGNWAADAELKPLTDAERKAEDARRAARVAADKAATAKRHADGAAKAKEDYAAAGECPKDHPYLKAKGIEPHPTWRMDAKNRIVVPLKLVSGEHVNNEYIKPDGEKRPVYGARKRGAAWAVGEPKDGRPAVLAEGLATAWTVHKATGEFTVRCGDAGELENVARAIREKDPGRHIVFAADNDVHLTLREGPRRKENVGIEKARAAAVAIGNASVWIPDAIDALAAKDQGTDFDNVRQMKGMAAVAASWKAFQGAPAAPAPRERERPEGPWAALQRAGNAMPAAAVREAPKEGASLGAG